MVVYATFPLLGSIYVSTDIFHTGVVFKGKSSVPIEAFFQPSVSEYI
jgi:hypothetical protein